MEMKEVPAASLPWPTLNKLLEPLERFKKEDGGYLLAPRNKHRLAATLYEIDQLSVENEVELSSRQLKKITEQGSMMKVEAGALHKEMAPHLFLCDWEENATLEQLILNGQLRACPAQLEFVREDGAIVEDLPFTKCLGQDFLADPKGMLISATFETGKLTDPCWVFKGDFVDALEDLSDQWLRLDEITSPDTSEKTLLLAEPMESLLHKLPTPPEMISPSTIVEYLVGQGRVLTKEHGQGYVWRDVLSNKRWYFV